MNYPQGGCNMYYMLNKDRVVAEFEIKKDPFGDEYKWKI